MTDMTVLPEHRASGPLRLSERSALVRACAVLLGTAILALSSQISVPMVPVPVTMQTLAVTLIGALYGWRLGAVTILAWLAEAAMGLPVLSNGGAGLAPFVGPTAGYLFAFPFVAAMVGYLAERGWNGRNLPLAFAAMLLGNALCLLIGAAWLATLIGVERALLAGVVPFLLGGLLKSALGATILKAFTRQRAQAPTA